MLNNKVTFLSYPLSNSTIGYGGEKQFKCTIVKNMKNGDSCNQSYWELSNHIGTHVDSHNHFSTNGKTITDFPASHWIYNKVELIDIKVEDGELIEPSSWCENINEQTELLLLRTGFEEHKDKERYWSRNPGLSIELGKWLRTNRPNIRTIGFDFISITSYLHRPMGKIAHSSFLSPEHDGDPLTVVEDMKLSHINSSIKMVIISPLRVENADGSPVTIFAFS